MAEQYQWTQRTDPAEAAEQMLAERIRMNKRTRLTWSREGEDDWMEQGRKGDFRPKLPYMLINRKYIVQNNMIMERNGVEIQLEDIPSDMDRMHVRKALEVYRAASMEADPTLCKICAQYRAKNYDDHMKHMLNIHPVESRAMLETDEVKEGVLTESPVPEGDNLTCTRCNRTFEVIVAYREHVKAHVRRGE
jgi:hypothetical protein